MSTPQPRRPVPLPQAALSRKQAALSRKQQRRQELLDTRLLRGIRPSQPAGAVVVMLLALALLWLELGIDAVLDHPLLKLGIGPRRLDGLVGIVLAPVLHASAAQLVALSIPFAVLGWLMLTSAIRHLALVTVGAALAAGLVGWLAGPGGSRLVGVSGVLLGWLGYLLARALVSRRVAWIAIAVAVTVVFSGLFNGLLPRAQQHEFWGSQLAAFAAGAGLAALLHRRNQSPSRRFGRSGRS